MLQQKKVYARNNHVNPNRRLFRRRFIVVRRISMPACSEKGTFHCLAHKEESKKRDSDERNYFPRAREEREGEAYEIEKEGEKVEREIAPREEAEEEDVEVKEKRRMNEERRLLLHDGKAASQSEVPDIE